MPIAGLAPAAANDDIGGVREEADLDALITRIQSDLRSGRAPPQSGPSSPRKSTSTPPPSISSREVRFRTELRRIRGRSLGRADIARLGARWLAPALIFAVVLIATLLFDKR